MPSPSIDTTFFFSSRLVKVPAFAHSSTYRQPGRNGKAKVVGPVYSDPSRLEFTTFLEGQEDEKAYLQACAALCGDFRSYTEVTFAGVEITHVDIWVESFTPTKSNACVCRHGGWVITGHFMVEMPEDW